MRTVAPAITRAVTAGGTGGLFVASLGSRTAMRTFACARCPSGLDARRWREIARLVRARGSAARSPDANSNPESPLSVGGQSGIEGEILAVGLHVVVEHRNVDRVARLRTVTASSVAIGGCSLAGIGVSMTVTTPSASARPLLIR